MVSLLSFEVCFRVKLTPLVLKLKEKPAGINSCAICAKLEEQNILFCGYLRSETILIRHAEENIAFAIDVFQRFSTRYRGICRYFSFSIALFGISNVSPS